MKGRRINILSTKSYRFNCFFFFFFAHTTSENVNENLKEIRKVYDEALSHTTLDIENYIEDELSYYGVYDFTAQNENITERFALSLNIYDNHLELVYNYIFCF